MKLKIKLIPVYKKISIASPNLSVFFRPGDLLDEGGVFGSIDERSRENQLLMDQIDLKKEEIILNICDIMISLELTKSFVKNVTHGFAAKEFGKESEQYKKTIGLITDKIIKTKYISQAR